MIYVNIKKTVIVGLGGNAPKILDNISFPNMEKYYFYLTLQSPLNKERQYSIFTPDFDTSLEYNSYPNCKVLLIEHEISEQSNCTKFKHPEIDDIYSLYEIGEDRDGPGKKIMLSNLEEKLYQYNGDWIMMEK